MKAHKKSGFTLIELLVVIVIIVILMGIALQVAKTAADRTRRAQTVRTMEALRNALAAYYSAYGQYPPTVGTSGSYPGQEMLPPPGDNAARVVSPQWTAYTNMFGHGVLFYLMAYKFKPVPACESDSSLPWFPHAREVETAKRWQHYLDDVTGINTNFYATNANFNDFFGNIGITNRNFTATDGWGSEITYASSPPSYQNYVLRSSNMTNGWEE